MVEGPAWLVVTMPDERDPRIGLTLRLPGRILPLSVGNADVRIALPAEGRKPYTRDELYTAMTSGTNGTVWRKAMADPALAAVVVDARRPEHHDLPWEELTEPGVPWSSRSETGPLLRGRWPLSTDPLAERELPVRVLVVLCGDDPRAEESLAAVYRGLESLSPCLWHVEPLRRPSPEELRVALERLPHVVHVIGHGIVPDGDSPEHVIQFSPHRSDPWTMDADTVRERFAAARDGSPLVVLGSCTTRGTWPRLVEAFTDAGAAGVVSFRGTISQDAERRFTEGLYRALSDGATVPAAVARARARVHEDLRHSAEANSFVLTMTRDPSAVVFCRDETRERFRQRDWTLAGSQAHWTLDRVHLRPKILTAIRPGGPPVTLLTGEARSGQSAVVQSCVATAHAEGRTLLPVDCRIGGNDLCTAETLAAMAGMPDVAENGHDRRVGNRADSLSREGPPPSPDAATLRRLRLYLQERAQASTDGLAVVIDHVHRFDGLPVLVSELVTPIVRNAGNRLKVVLVGEWKEVEGIRTAAGVQTLHVPCIRPRDAEELARELVAKDRWRLSDDDQYEADAVMSYEKTFMEWAVGIAGAAHHDDTALPLAEFIDHYSRLRTKYKLPPMCRA